MLNGAIDALYGGLYTQLCNERYQNTDITRNNYDLPINKYEVSGKIGDKF